MKLWSQDSGLTDVTAAFQGFTQPLHEIIDDIHRRGWTVGKVHIKDDQYVAEGKNPHGEKLVASGRTDATAAANLLVKIMRREHMRSSSLKEKLGAWDHAPIEQQFSQIAQAYAGAPIYEPKAAPAWMELAQDCARRAAVIRMQVAIEYTADPVPYESADELREDVTKKRHVMVTRAYPHHPIWSEQQMLDYRLVVDVLGHVVGGGDWGWHGTVLAFSALAPMLAEQPQKALFTELLGQGAFGSFYRQWGPQKICFLDELVEKEQEKANKPGHSGVHPSQSLVPGALPSIFGAMTGPSVDPNAEWESGVQPLPDAAYLWQRQNGVDPLDIQGVTDNLYPLETGVSRMHPQMAQQAVVNALRSSLLGTRNNAMGHAIHYQDVMHIPAGVDDPIAYWDALEQQRDHWNQGKGYAPGSHKQHWPEEQQFKQWVKATNPHLDDGDVQRLAKRELLHMLIEEEERVLAQDQGEQLPSEVVEHEAYEAMKRRLGALTKSTVDEKVDFGKNHLYHESNLEDQMKWKGGGCGALAHHLHSQTGWPLVGSLYDPDDDDQRPDHFAVLHPSGDVLDINGLSEWDDMHHRLVEPEELEAHMNDGLLPHHTDPEYTDAPQVATRLTQELGRQAKTATHHADMYPPYLASRMRPLAQISRHADKLAQAARDDLLMHSGRGHHFRAQALNLGIPGLGPRQASHAWLHLAPQTSQLGVIEPQLMETLGHNYETDMSNREYFKHERELAAARDASGYNHVPLGPFSAGLWDLKAGGPGWHRDRTPLKAYSPAPHQGVDWSAQTPTFPDWGDPYWWTSTQEARDQVARDFDRNVGVNTPRDEVPFQRTAAADGRAPWVLDPMSGQRLTGAPGLSLMQHVKQSLGHPDVHSVWGQDYEVGKS